VHAAVVGHQVERADRRAGVDEADPGLGQIFAAAAAAGQAGQPEHAGQSGGEQPPATGTPERGQDAAAWQVGRRGVGVGEHAATVAMARAGRRCVARASRPAGRADKKETGARGEPRRRRTGVDGVPRLRV
jgi:hypothetical protein